MSITFLFFFQFRHVGRRKIALIKAVKYHSGEDAIGESDHISNSVCGFQIWVAHKTSRFYLFRRHRAKKEMRSRRGKI